MNLKIFNKALVLGGGFSGKVAALALDRQNFDVTLFEQNPKTSETFHTGSQLDGKLAHSHIFLPRLLKDGNRILPEWICDMKAANLHFRPGSKMVGRKLQNQRLFAARWQVESTLEKKLLNTTRISRVTDSFLEAEVDDQRCLKSLRFKKSGSQKIDSDALVVDAMGGSSQLIKNLALNSSEVVEHRSYVCYITQFLKFEAQEPKRLPDALDRCTWKHKDWYISLYPAANGWFSITAVIDARNQVLKRELGRGDGLLKIANQHKSISCWLQKATPLGQPSVYLDPKNTWFLDPLKNGHFPKNYCPIGDALISTSPVLGAGCSFAVTHVAELVSSLNKSDWQIFFAQAVSNAQSNIFEESISYKPPNGNVDSDLLSTFSVRSILRNFPGLSLIRKQRALRLRSTL